MAITLKKIIRLSITAMTIIVVAVVSCYIVVLVNANSKIYNTVEDIPYNKVGLLLGTSPVTPQVCDCRSRKGRRPKSSPLCGSQREINPKRQGC